MSEVNRAGYLAAYDVSDASRRQRIWQRVQAYAAELGQRSAHVVWLTPAERRALLAVVVELLDGAEDQFLLLRLDAHSTPLLRGRAVGAAHDVPSVYRFD